MKKISLIIILLISTLPALIADEVTFSASANEMVEVGERFQLTYTLNAEGDNFKGPDLKNFRHIMGPSTYSSYSTQIVNNKMTQSVTLTYTYVVQATKEGTFTIEPASVNVSGETFRSNPVTVKVISSKSSGKKTQQSDQSKSRQRNSKREPSSKESITSDDIFIKALVSNTNPWVGEQIIVTYKIFTRIPLTQLNISKYPSLPGFWSEDLMKNQQITESGPEVINGIQYSTAELKKVALFPQKSGKLKLDPLEADCIAPIKIQQSKRRSNDPFERFFDDPFFNRNIRNVELKLSSDPVTINVSQLPLTNKPASFSGAVGYFDINTQVDKQNLKANEALTYKVKISGRGNLELIDKFNISFPPDFEVYDPKIINKISTSGNGISGSRTFEYLLIPRNAGNFIIPSVRFSYFNTNTGNYITKTTQEYTIKVEKGDLSPGQTSYSGINQEDVKYIGRDIRHINQGPLQFTPVGYYLFNSITFYLWIGGLLTISLLMIFLIRQNQKKKANVALMKNKKATRVAKRNLKKANEFMNSGNENEFFLEISRALWGYLGDKFNIPRANLSIDNIKETLQGKSISEATIDMFTDTLNNTEYARFSPADSTKKMQDIYQQAIKVISKIEKELR